MDIFEKDFSIKCWLGKHEYKIAAIESGFYTTITDYGKSRKQPHVLHYKKCKFCGKRSYEVYGDGWKTHTGVQSAIDLWMANGTTANLKDKDE